MDNETKKKLVIVAIAFVAVVTLFIITLSNDKKKTLDTDSKSAVVEVSSDRTSSIMDDGDVQEGQDEITVSEEELTENTETESETETEPAEEMEMADEITVEGTELLGLSEDESSDLLSAVSDILQSSANPYPEFNTIRFTKGFQKPEGNSNAEYCYFVTDNSAVPAYECLRYKSGEDQETWCYEITSMGDKDNKGAGLYSVYDDAI